MADREPLPKDPTPAFRELRVFALDPVLAANVETIDVAIADLRIRWNDLRGPGPIGEYLEVIDYDPSEGCFYPPVDLQGRSLLATKGLAPTESDPRFHQQTVYAVAMNTIQTFEAALGRRVLWSDRMPGFRPVDRLRIYPHALREKNAYYDPERKALLFGYFRAGDAAKGSVTAGTYVFTALSFDIVTHETTHAILDGMHRRFIEDTNPDVLAFHEAFADIVALCQHFSLPEFLRHQIANARGALDAENLLAQLATQFGQGTGQYGALRDAIGIMEPPSRDEYELTIDAGSGPETKGRLRRPIGLDVPRWRRVTPRDLRLDDLTEPHARGAVLVSAVFDAFLGIYKRRTADLLRLASGGSGLLSPGAIAPDLVGRLADEASKIARHVLRMCIRALDYLPPVDITFGDYLRAIVTADYDILRNDRFGYRVSFIQAFQKWGITPRDVANLGEQALLWQPLGGLMDEKDLSPDLRRWFREFDGKIRTRMADFRFSDPRSSSRTWSDRTAKMVYGRILELFEAKFVDETSESPIRPGRLFGLETPKNGEKIEVHSVRPLQRPPVDADERSTTDLIIVLTQWRWVDRETLEDVAPAQDAPRRQPPETFLFRGGATIVYDVDGGRFKYVVRKGLSSRTRRSCQRDYRKELGRPLYFDGGKQPFRMLHNPGAER